jgi:ABC-type hemin transport system ATPase subunit
VQLECTGGGSFAAAERLSRRNISTLPITDSIALDVMRFCAAAGKLPARIGPQGAGSWRILQRLTSRLLPIARTRLITLRDIANGVSP